MQEQHQSNKKCVKCKETFIYTNEDTEWAEFGTYSEKFTRCPYCGTINAIKYIDSPGLNANRDKRFYKNK